MSGCWSKRLYDMLQRSCIASGNLRKVYDVNDGTVTGQVTSVMPTSRVHAAANDEARAERVPLLGATARLHNSEIALR